MRIEPLIVIFVIFGSLCCKERRDASVGNTTTNGVMPNDSITVETNYESVIRQVGKRIRVRGAPTAGKGRRLLILSGGEIEWTDPIPTKHGQPNDRPFPPITIDADVTFQEPYPPIREEIVDPSGIVLPIPQQVERGGEGYFLLTNCTIVTE